MSLTERINHSTAAVIGWQWTNNGNTYAVYDCGICYTCYYNGRYVGAIDGTADVNQWATVNHYTGAGCPVTI